MSRSKIRSTEQNTKQSQRLQRFVSPPFVIQTELFRSRRQHASLSPRARRSYLWERMEIRCKPQNRYVYPYGYSGHPVSPIRAHASTAYLFVHARTRVHLSLILPRYVACHLCTTLNCSPKFHSCQEKSFLLLENLQSLTCYIIFFLTLFRTDGGSIGLSR